MRPPRLLPLIDAERARAAGLDPVALVAALAAVGASAVWWRDPSPAGPVRDARAAAAIASAGDATLVLRGGDCAAALAVEASAAAAAAGDASHARALVEEMLETIEGGGGGDDEGALQETRIELALELRERLEAGRV